MFERIQKFLELPERVTSLSRDFDSLRREVLAQVEAARVEEGMKPELAILMMWGTIFEPSSTFTDGVEGYAGVPYDPGKKTRPGIVSRVILLRPGQRDQITFQPDFDILIQRWMLFASHECYVENLTIASVMIADLSAKCGDTSLRCTPANRITAHIRREAL